MKSASVDVAWLVLLCVVGAFSFHLLIDEQICKQADSMSLIGIT